MKSKLFAKVFESEKYGQIVIMNDSVDGDPVVQIHINPNDGRMTSQVKFVDTDKGWKAQMKAFNGFDLEKAEEYVEKNMWEIAEEFYSEEGLFGGEDEEMEDTYGMGN